MLFIPPPNQFNNSRAPSTVTKEATSQGVVPGGLGRTRHWRWKKYVVRAPVLLCRCVVVLAARRRRLVLVPSLSLSPSNPLLDGTEHDHSCSRWNASMANSDYRWEPNKFGILLH
jgi:hypothetical protein